MQIEKFVGKILRGRAFAAQQLVLQPSKSRAVENGFDQALEMTEDKPVKVGGRSQDVLLEGLNRELVEIQSPAG